MFRLTIVVVVVVVVENKQLKLFLREPNDFLREKSSGFGKIIYPPRHVFLKLVRDWPQHLIADSLVLDTQILQIACLTELQL